MKRDRIAEIAELLDKRGKLTLKQLESYFPNVSQMTLRRDMFQLEKEGKIIRVRGGAMSVHEVQKTSGEPYVKKTTIHTDEKIVIAQKAAGLIDEGSSLFIDGGTTALYLAKEMPDRYCNVFTNGLAVATELAKKKNVVVNLLGGQLIKENLSTASSFSSLSFLPFRPLRTSKFQFIAPFANTGRCYFLVSEQESNQRSQHRGGADREVYRYFLSQPPLLPRLRAALPYVPLPAPIEEFPVVGILGDGYEHFNNRLQHRKICKCGT